MSSEDPFDGVLPELRVALQRRGFETLTAVQVAVQNAAAEGRNVRVSSQTGSGKTVAIGLALGRDLLEATRNAQGRVGPVALIITPTRELAAQVREELSWLFAELPGFSTGVVTGGTDIMRERRELQRNPHLLVGTPGRLLDHMRSGKLKFDSLRHVALDEADRMLDMGFKDELDDIINQLPPDRRSHLISATFPVGVRRLADKFQENALVLEGTRLGAANEDIEHTAHVVKDRERYNALVNTLLLLDGERCLVFVQRRADTAEIAELLAGDGFPAMAISGDLSQPQRNRALHSFRSGVTSTLVATDVAARGIDVADIAAVIHLDLPRRPDDYIHRSGRTGRAGKQGRSIALVTPSGRRQAVRLFSIAKIEAKWSALPTAKKIEKTLVKRWRKGLHDRIGEGAEAIDPKLQEYAAHLLATLPPEQVVAALLQMAQPKTPRRAMELTPVDDAPARSRPRDANANFVKFSVTWGTATGATHARLLAQLCRRGDISSADVGAIEIRTRNSTVEVAQAVAAAFERQVKSGDSRDAGIKFAREPGEPAPSSGKTGRPGPPRGGPAAPRRHSKHRPLGAKRGAPGSKPAATGPGGD